MTQERNGYTLFSQGQIGGMTLPNRFVRSSTADSLMHRTRQVSDEDIALYRRLAQGGVGLIVTGGFRVTPPRFAREDGLAQWNVDYEEVRIDGLERLARAVAPWASSTSRLTVTPSERWVIRRALLRSAPSVSKTPSPSRSQR